MTATQKRLPQPKPGYTTTEFWVTIVSNIIAIIAVVFHKNVGLNVSAVSAAGALLGNITYSVTRAYHKTNLISAALSGLNPNDIMRLLNDAEKSGS